MCKALVLVITFGALLAALPAGGLDWDPRLNGLGVSLVPASPAPGQSYYELISAIYQDDTQSGGNHNIYFNVLDEAGQKMMGMSCCVGWPGDRVCITEAKPFEEYWYNFAMYSCYDPAQGPGPYYAEIDGLPSDRVTGMGLPGCHHVNFLLTYQCTTSGTSAGTTLVGAGWHLVSIPNAPNDPSPPTVFNPIIVSGRLHRYDPDTKSYVTYPSTNPPFGDCQVGHGYWLWITATSSFSYLGAPMEGEQAIPLTQAGWHLIGHPFNSPVPLSQCQIRKTATGETKSVVQARAAGWISLPLYYWDAAAGYQRCGSEAWDTASSLVTWRGYWLRTDLAGLELRIPPP